MQVFPDRQHRLAFRLCYQPGDQGFLRLLLLLLRTPVQGCIALGQRYVEQGRKEWHRLLQGQGRGLQGEFQPLKLLCRCLLRAQLQHPL